MSDQPSWVRKLDRAQHHFADLQAWINGLPPPDPHLGYLRVGVHDDPEYRFRYFCNVIAPGIDDCSVILGDCLFNIRSALDHVAVSSVPAAYQKEAQFPIMRQMPIDAARAADGATEKVSTWRRQTKGMTAVVLAYVESCQPWHQAARDGTEPDDHPLAALAKLQNADKHRQLNLVASGLLEPRLTVIDEGIRKPIEIDRPGYLLENGTPILSANETMDVHLMGVPEIVVSTGLNEPYRKLAEVQKIIKAARIITAEIARLNSA
jgi:hypothetical protein